MPHRFHRLLAERQGFQAALQAGRLLARLGRGRCFLQMHSIAILTSRTCRQSGGRAGRQASDMQISSSSEARPGSKWQHRQRSCCGVSQPAGCSVTPTNGTGRRPSCRRCLLLLLVPRGQQDHALRAPHRSVPAAQVIAQKEMTQHSPRLWIHSMAMQGHKRSDAASQRVPGHLQRGQRHAHVNWTQHGHLQAWRQQAELCTANC